MENIEHRTHTMVKHEYIGYLLHGCLLMLICVYERELLKRIRIFIFHLTKKVIDDDGSCSCSEQENIGPYAWYTNTYMYNSSDHHYIV